MGNSLTPINPWTARPGRPVPVVDPYNLYFTVDGRYAIVVAERLRRLDFRDPHSMRLRHSLAVPGCAGVDHMDFNADGRFALASCEFGARLIVVDIPHQRVARPVALWSLQLRGLRDQHYHRQADPARPGRQRAPRPLRLPSTRTILARPYRRLSLTTVPQQRTAVAREQTFAIAERQ